MVKTLRICSRRSAMVFGNFVLKKLNLIEVEIAEGIASSAGNVLKNIPYFILMYIQYSYLMP
ncbi:hypothetical protein CsSME_00000585 [Camellia sinensis var. sinensis]